MHSAAAPAGDGARLRTARPHDAFKAVGAPWCPPLYNAKGEPFNPKSGQDPLNPVAPNGEELPPYIYYNPNDIDGCTARPFGLNNTVVCYRGTQPMKNYRANTEKSIRDWNEKFGNRVEMDTRDVMYSANETFDGSKLVVLLPIPGVKYEGPPDDEEDIRPEPQLATRSPWDTIGELLPLMRAIADKRYGRNGVTVLQNVHGYYAQYNWRDWPLTVTDFYIHLRDPTLRGCTAEAIRYSPNRASLQLCTINGRSVECNLVECEVDGHMARLYHEWGGIRTVYYITKSTAGRGKFSWDSGWRLFNSIDELIAIVSDLIPGQVELDENGYEPRRNMSEDW